MRETVWRPRDTRGAASASAVQGDFVRSESQYEAVLAELAIKAGLEINGPVSSKEGLPGDVSRSAANQKVAAPKGKKKASEQVDGVLPLLLHSLLHTADKRKQ